MKKLIILLFLSLSISVFAEDKKVTDGFRGFEWGTPLEEMEDQFNLKILSKLENNSLLFVSNISSVGGATVHSCSFIFYDNKFYGVIIVVNGNNNIKIFKEAAFNYYGLPTSSNEVNSTYFWDNDISERHLLINDNKNESSFMMWSIKINDKIDSDIKDKINDDF